MKSTVKVQFDAMLKLILLPVKSLLTRSTYPARPAPQQAVQIIDGALTTIDEYRADMGAVQNRLESTIDNLSNIHENLTTAQSRIKDVDFAKETASMSSDQMKMQAGMSVMTQAKSMSQFAVQMLGN